MTEEEVERERMEWVFSLTGGELNTRHDELPDIWDTSFRYWYEGAPEYACRELGVDSGGTSSYEECPDCKGCPEVNCGKCDDCTAGRPCDDPEECLTCDGEGGWWRDVRTALEDLSHCTMEIGHKETVSMKCEHKEDPHEGPTWGFLKRLEKATHSCGFPDCPGYDEEVWEVIAFYSSTSGETGCGWCGAGCDKEYVEAREARVKRRELGIDVPEDEENMCPLCEDSGYIYIGSGWAEVVYRKAHA